MIEIQVNNLVKSFEVGHNVLDGVTFQIDQGQRVGLLGKNGAGKSTLFKILIGELDCDEGTVTISPGHRMGLISQIPVYPEGYTVDDVLRSAFGRLHALTAEMEELAGRMAAGETDPAILKRYGSLSERFEVFGGYDTDVAISKVANGLSISDDMRGRLFDQLSGGEKTRVNLGRLILEDTDILLLDEPTNHLDLQATEWLEEYIRTFRGTVVTISHDRYFLDRTVTRIIEVLDGKAEFYSGNYSFYAVEKERRYQERLKQYLKEQAKIQQLEKAAEQMHLWAFMGNDALHKRAFSMEKRIQRMRTTEKPTKAKKMDARFASRQFKGDEVLQVKGVSKAFDGRTLFSDTYLRVENGERIALIGENGTLFEFTSLGGKINPQRVQAGPVFVDGLGVGDVGNIVIRDRQQLAQDGVVIVVIALEKGSNQVLAGPDIVSRGFVYVRDSEALLTEARERIESVLDRCEAGNVSEWNAIKTQVRDALGKYFFDRTKRRPMILTIIQEVK